MSYILQMVDMLANISILLDLIQLDIYYFCIITIFKI